LAGQATPSSEEFAALLSAVASGDRAAFALLFDFFAPRLVTFLRQGGLPTDASEDLAQEVMVLAWRKARSFDPTRGSVSAWLFTIARNLRTDRYRRDRNEPIVLDGEDHDALDTGLAPEDQLHRLQRERLVRVALMRLPSEQLRLLQLSFFAGQPHTDIARDLSLPLGTVKSRIRQALTNLRRSLEGLEP
jgi:RNA polymerase sigma factor (sigma-70 family)